MSESRLEHYAYRGSPPDWRCRAALPHAFNRLRSRAPRRQPEAALQDHSPTHRGVGATRVAHRGGPSEDDGQTALTSAFAPRSFQLGRRRRASTAPPARSLQPRKPASTTTFPRRNRAATTRAQPQRVGGTRTAWARTPAGHARGIDVTRESNAPTGAPSFETRALTLAAPRRIHQASELGRCYAERLARHKHSALRICSTAQEGRRVA